jgi:signal recognition particle receptor subunit beta
MAFVNYNNKEITVKIVYYGPALSGKTTCLQYIYGSKQFKKKGKLITLDTDGDRTLFFDFLPLEIGKLGDYSIKMQLYTVPGQVVYDTTRKLVLQGSDGIVFVADSQVVIKKDNIDSFQNLKDNLKANNLDYAEMPLIFQYNKRDLKEILPIEIMNDELNKDNNPFFPTIGTTGENVQEALHTIMKMVIIHLKNKLTIFQKDKTVMFSREEVTDDASAEPIPEPELEPIEDEKLDEENEDTEKEEVFELSSPIEDESLKTQDFKGSGKEGEEEIFNLEDENIVEEKHEETEVPLVDVNKDTKVVVSGDVDIAAKSIEVPIQVEIPKDKDEFKVNLNLQILIKKK